MAGKIDLQPAFVLHTRGFRDTSLLVDILTLDHGLVRAVARGARRPRSHQRAVLQPFVPLLVSCSGRGELLTLTAVEQSAPPLTLLQARLFSGLYVNELLVRLLPLQESCPAIFRQYRTVLLQLRADDSVEPALRLFELQLLQELGYGIDLHNEWRTGTPIDPAQWYLFQAEQGFERLPEPGQRRHELPVFSGADLLAIAERRLDGASAARSAKRLLRIALASHLGDRPLRSRSLFRRREYRDPGSA